jgi:hypothetical protein
MSRDRSRTGLDVGCVEPDSIPHRPRLVRRAQARSAVVARRIAPREGRAADSGRPAGRLPRRSSVVKRAPGFTIVHQLAGRARRRALRRPPPRASPPTTYLSTTHRTPTRSSRRRKTTPSRSCSSQDARVEQAK